MERVPSSGDLPPASPKKGRTRASVDVTPREDPPGSAPHLSEEAAKLEPSPTSRVPPLAPSIPSVEGGQSPAVTHADRAGLDSSLSGAIANLARLHRSRLNFVSAKVKIELQIKAIQRQEHARAGCQKATHATCPGVYDVVTEDVELLRTVALGPLERQANLRLGWMLDEAKALPTAVLAFADETRGFGRPSLAQIVAEAGDLSRYSNPAKLWSRMGRGLDAEGSARYEGRSPRRSALMRVIGTNFVRASSGPYRELYDSRKAFEQTKPSCGKMLKNAKGEAIGVCKAKDAECCRPGHIHNRSLRYIEKRLLRELWRAWNSAGEGGQTRRGAQAGAAASPAA